MAVKLPSLATAAVLAATGLNTLASHVVPTDQQTLGAIILMIGMAVGIDYSLFYLKREREERRHGRSPHDALLAAARTSGQAVLVSGATVLIAMAGMFVSGNSLFTTIGLGSEGFGWRADRFARALLSEPGIAEDPEVRHRFAELAADFLALRFTGYRTLSARNGEKPYVAI